MRHEITFFKYKMLQLIVVISKINTTFAPTWLRIYAIKLEPGCYIITGGAIKLTRTMQERAHTLAELNKMEQVRNFLLDGGAIDTEGFVDYLSEIQ